MSGAADTYRREDKRRSWNEYGSVYWARAGTSSHPSVHEAETFLGGCGQGCRVLVAGATTTELIAAAVERGAEVHVLDFADRLLGLVGDRFGARVHTHLHDICEPAPSHLAAQMDVVVADRLVNRFHHDESAHVVGNLMSFVRPGGDLRVSIRLGLYPLDRKLIERGTELGTLSRFWDEATSTIDWAEVGQEIDDVAEAHGDIPPDVVADWSRLRGVESRIWLADVAQIARRASVDRPKVAFGDGITMDVAPDSMIFIATKDVHGG